MPPKRETDRAGQASQPGGGAPVADDVLPAAVPAPSASTPRRPASRAKPDMLGPVRRAAKSRVRADERLQDACRDARPHHSLRDIAEAAGVSYDTVDRWTK